jgi:hypothetical protein
VIPDTDAGLVEFFLDTEAREIEVEIGRLRPRLNEAFFSHVSREIAQIKFAVTRTAVRCPCSQPAKLASLVIIPSLLTSVCVRCYRRWKTD